jgi:predicted MFS family arabinose efflux permease
MFILGGIVLGVVLAVMLGGRPGRVTQVRFRHAWLVVVAILVQLGVAADPAGALMPEQQHLVHLVSYGLLLLFAAANLALRPLIPVSVGLILNTIAIAANGGVMPVSGEALAAAGIAAGPEANVGARGGELLFLGDVFALPAELPWANVFSIGDLLIALGGAGFIVVHSFEGRLAGAVRARRLVEPLKERAFRRLAVGALVSRVGDWLTLAALIGWVYKETDSTAAVAALMLVRLAPPILGGGLAAVLVDRFAKNRLLVAVEALRALALAGAAFGVLSGTLWAVFAALAASGLLAALSTATVPALVPFILDERKLAAGNAGLGVGQDVALALGALGAGVVLTTASIGIALAVDAATFLLAAALYLRLPRGLVGPAQEEEDDSGALAGVRYVARRPILVTIIVSFGVATVATGLTNATLPSLLDELGLGPSAYGFGLAALGAGLVAGQAVTGGIRMDASAVQWMRSALALMAVALVGLAYTDHGLTALLFLAFVGFLDGTTDVVFDTVVQRVADPRYLGRVFGLGSAFFTTTMMVSLASAPLVHRIGAPGRVILIAAVFVFGAAVVAAIGTARARPRAALAPVRPPALDSRGSG